MECVQVDAWTVTLSIRHQNKWKMTCKKQNTKQKTWVTKWSSKMEGIKDS